MAVELSFPDIPEGRFFWRRSSAARWRKVRDDASLEFVARPDRGEDQVVEPLEPVLLDPHLGPGCYSDHASRVDPCPHCGIAPLSASDLQRIFIWTGILANPQPSETVPTFATAGTDSGDEANQA